jgi:predicted HTH transcriptional regulator
VTPQEIPRGLQRRKATLLAALAHHASLTRREYQLLAGISHTTARHDLAELITNSLIVRLGSARASRYGLPPAPASPSDAE